jgi:glyoxylase-like metal-dependent hydrolase (beta-lactamase superfamily II)
MVPNGTWGESNSGLILGDGEALLIDTQWDLKYTRAMLAAMETVLEGRPIKRAVNTHADGDHFWGNELLADAETIASRAACEEMPRLRPGSLVLVGRVGRVLSHVPLFGADRVGLWLRTMVAPYDFGGVTMTPARRRLTGRETLNVGGRAVELIEVGPAHTEGDVIAYLPKEKVVFAGDVVFIGSTPVAWAGPLENCIRALDVILGMDVEVIVPGHGPITDKAGVREVRAYWEFVAERTRRCHEEGLSAQAAAREIALSPEFAAQPFATWDSPERIVVSVDTQYRHYAGRPKHPGRLGMLDLSRKQALLANQLPDAEPHAQRKMRRSRS